MIRYTQEDVDIMARIKCEFLNEVIKKDDSCLYLEVFYDVNSGYYIMHGIFVNREQSYPFHVSAYYKSIGEHKDLYWIFVDNYINRRLSPQCKQKGQNGKNGKSYYADNGAKVETVPWGFEQGDIVPDDFIPNNAIGRANPDHHDPMPIEAPRPIRRVHHAGIDPQQIRPNRIWAEAAEEADGILRGDVHVGMQNEARAFNNNP